MSTYKRNTKNTPQKAQSVNVGQFGPSHDSLQDWRSVFTAASEVKKISEDLQGMEDEIKAVIADTAEAVRLANLAAAQAIEINETTITTVQGSWQDIVEAKLSVESSEASAAASAELATDKAVATAEDVLETEQFVIDSSKLKIEMEDIRDDVTHLTVGLTIVDEAPQAKAEFDSTKNHLHLFVPKVTAGAGAILSVNNKLGPDVFLTAADVGALPDDGSVAIKDKLNFAADPASPDRMFELNAIMANTHKGVAPEFSISYQYTGIKDNKHGLILDKDGNGAFGGELFVRNTNDFNTRKKVYHEGYPPTPAAVGAAAAADTYTKNEVYSKGETNSREEIASLVNRKVELNESDGIIYARQNSNWIDIGRRLAALESSANNLSLMFPVGHMLITTNSSNPSTYGYPGTWERQDADCSIHTTVGSAGGVSGTNTPVVPLPAHEHSASFRGNDLPPHNHRQVGNGHQNGGSSGAYGDGGSFSVSVESKSAGTPSGSVTINSAGTSGATLDVRGKRIEVQLWKRIA